MNVAWQADSLNPRNVSANVAIAGGSGLLQVVVIELPLTPANAGAFTVAHGLSTAPPLVTIEMESGGEIWFQPSPRYDDTLIHLVASAGGVAGKAQCWLATALQEIALTPSDAGNFTVAHTLGITPVLVLLQMTSGGAIWQQVPVADASNVYLVASAGGITGYAELWTIMPVPIVALRSLVALTPSDAGDFSIAHGLGKMPALANIQMTSGGRICFQSPTRYDTTELFLTASAGGITGYCEVWG